LTTYFPCVYSFHFPNMADSTQQISPTIAGGRNTRFWKLLSFSPILTKNLSNWATITHADAILAKLLLARELEGIITIGSFVTIAGPISFCNFFLPPAHSRLYKFGVTNLRVKQADGQFIWIVLEHDSVIVYEIGD
jgi:hypothetical protein